MWKRSLLFRVESEVGRTMQYLCANYKRRYRRLYSRTTSEILAQTGAKAEPNSEPACSPTAASTDSSIKPFKDIHLHSSVM